jgi:hypothetical protein
VNAVVKIYVGIQVPYLSKPDKKRTCFKNLLNSFNFYRNAETGVNWCDCKNARFGRNLLENNVTCPLYVYLMHSTRQQKYPFPKTCF